MARGRNQAALSLASFFTLDWINPYVRITFVLVFAMYILEGCCITVYIGSLLLEISWIFLLYKLSLFGFPLAGVV